MDDFKGIYVEMRCFRDETSKVHELCGVWIWDGELETLVIPFGCNREHTSQVRVRLKARAVLPFLSTIMERKKPILLQSKTSTPIPPSLQAKMAAIANRAAAGSDAGPPSLRLANSFPEPKPRSAQAPTGLAARRTRPTFNLRDIDASLVPPPNAMTSGGGLIGAGLGAGRPTLDLGSRRSQAGTPFANFSKIVYVSVPFILLDV